jgi:hypothetical protein
MSARIRQHIRSNVYGLVAVFIVLGGTAYAIDGPLPGQDQVGSGDIIDTEVKAPDIGKDAVRSDEVQDEALTGADVDTGGISSSEVLNNTLTHFDLGGDSVSWPELDPDAFNSEIAELSPGFVFGIANNSIQSEEVSANSLSGSDIFEASLEPSIHAVAESSHDTSFGPTITARPDDPEPDTVISDTIGAGTWVVLGELRVFNDDDDATSVDCGIYTDNTRRELASEGLEALLDDSGDRVNLPLTAAFTTSTATTLRLACINSEFGDDGVLRPASADLVAIPVNSLG